MKILEHSDLTQAQARRYNVYTPEQVLIDIGFTKAVRLKAGEIGIVDDILCSEKGWNIGSCKGDARILVHLDTTKYKKWCAYWLSRGRKPIATVRIADEFPEGWDGRCMFAVIGVGLSYDN